jgi:hypothetical protein
MVFYCEKNDNDAHYHHLFILFFYYEEDDNGTVVVVFLWSSIMKKTTMTMSAIIIIFFYFFTTKRTIMTPSSSSFSYCHFASVKKTMNPTRHPFMLFCNCEKMTTNNYATHRHYGVVLQEQKNDNKQCNSLLF